MKCVQAQRLIRPYLDDKLPDDKLAPFLEHISECKDCQEDLAIYTALYSALDQNEEDEESNYDFVHAMQQRMRETEYQLEKRMIISNTYRMLVVFAEIVLLVLLISAISHHLEQEQSARHLSYDMVMETEGISEIPSAILAEETEEIRAAH